MTPAAFSTPADASVRDATAVDTDAMGQVQSAAWRSSYGALLPAEALEALEPEALAEAWRDAVVRPPSGSHRVLVALAGGAVVGFVAVAPSEVGPAVAEIVALVVAPEAQRAGHGSRLLNAAVDRVRGEGFELVVGWVLEADEIRQRFLAGAGFADDGGRREFAMGDDAGGLREMRLAASLREDG